MESKGVYTFERKPLCTAFLHSIKLSGHKTKIKFDKDPLAVEQNNYTTKTVNASIPYELDTWPKTSRNNFRFKNSLFGVTDVVKNTDKEKLVYSGYGIAGS